MFDLSFLNFCFDESRIFFLVFMMKIFLIQIYITVRDREYQRNKFIFVERFKNNVSNNVIHPRWKIKCSFLKNKNISLVRKITSHEG